MDEKELNTAEPMTTEEPFQRQWVTPSFERIDLKEALSGPINNPTADNTTGSS